LPEAVHPRLERRNGRGKHYPQELLVAPQQAQVGQGRVEPAPEAVAAVLPAGAETEPALEACPERGPGVMATLKGLEVEAHALAAPALVLGRLGDLVPVLGQAADRDHGVVDRAAPHPLGARVEDAALVTTGALGPVDFGVETAVRVVVEVLDEVAQRMALILG